MHFEDLKVGQWVAMTMHDPTAANPETIRDMETLRPAPRRAMRQAIIREYNGLPMKIIAKSVPFILLEMPDGRAVQSLDIRTVHLTPLDKKYVKLYRDTMNRNITLQPEEDFSQDPLAGLRSDEDTFDPLSDQEPLSSQEDDHDSVLVTISATNRDCPGCNDSLREVRAANGEVNYYCPTCGWSTNDDDDDDPPYVHEQSSDEQ